MKHEELVRKVLAVMCDSLGAEWDIDRLTPMVKSAALTVSENLRTRTVDAIREVVGTQEPQVEYPNKFEIGASIHTTWPHSPRCFTTMEDVREFAEKLNKPVCVTVSGVSNILRVLPSGRCEDTGKPKQ